MSKPFVTVELDKPRKLRYGMNALVIIEDMLGKPISGLNLDNLSMKDMRTIIYAGLCHEDEELTPEIVGNLIDEHSNINDMAKSIEKAFEEAFGKNVKRPMEKKVK